jgi:hypothetical protein
MTRFATPLAAAFALGLGLGLSGPAGAAPDGGSAARSTAAIPVTFTSVTPDVSHTALCDRALEAVAVGARVPFAAADCLRTYLLEADPAAPAVAEPAPVACEALLPSLAVGAPVRLGAAVPCIEAYINAPGQVATR